MSRFQLLELIQKDIEGLKWLFGGGKNKLTKIQICRTARRLVVNLEDCLANYIELENKKKKPTRKLKNHLCQN